MTVKMIANSSCLYLNLFGESGGEHECLSFSNIRHVVLLNNAANLGLETHVQHTISFIQNKESVKSFLEL